MLAALRLHIGGRSRGVACNLRSGGLGLRARLAHSSPIEASAGSTSGSTAPPQGAAVSEDGSTPPGGGSAGAGLPSTSAGEVIKAGFADSLMQPRHRARPYVILNDLQLYESSVNIQETVTDCRRNCFIGAGLASAGFATLLASIAGAVPPAAFTVLLCGACVNSYALVVVAQRVLRGMAVRHVESITILPTDQDSSASSSTDADGATGLGDLHHGAGAATAEERLAVTPELHLEVRTASAVRWLTLVEPGPEQADINLDPQGRQASFGEICSELRLLHIETDSGHACADVALLVALVGSRKVIVDERAEPRDDSAEALRVNPGSPAPGPMLSEASVEDVEKVGKVVSVLPPEQMIDSLGRRARNAGCAVLVTGTLFAVGESARDRDGIARWTNLPGV